MRVLPSDVQPPSVKGEKRYPGRRTFDDLEEAAEASLARVSWRRKLSLVRMGRRSRANSGNDLS
jgi:hypothetical protein